MQEGDEPDSASDSDTEGSESDSIRESFAESERAALPGQERPSTRFAEGRGELFCFSGGAELELPVAI